MSLKCTKHLVPECQGSSFCIWTFYVNNALLRLASFKRFREFASTFRKRIFEERNAACQASNDTKLSAQRLASPKSIQHGELGVIRQGKRWRSQQDVHDRGRNRLNNNQILLESSPLRAVQVLVGDSPSFRCNTSRIHEPSQEASETKLRSACSSQRRHCLLVLPLTLET